MKKIGLYYDNGMIARSARGWIITKRRIQIL